MSEILWEINLFEINSPVFNNLPNPLSLKLQKKSRIDYKIFKSELGSELKHIDLSFQPISHPNQHKIYKSPKVPKNRILGAQELINGNTQQELADRWWAQTLSTPFNINPFVTDDSTDPRGRRGSVERHENFQLKSPNGVSFLGGILSGNSPATRTIVGRPGIVYFAPFANQLVDNTTVDSSPEAGFPGGYAFTEQHLSDLSARGLNPRDPSSVLGQEEGSLPTLLDLARFVADTFTEQFVKIDGNDVTPANIQEYRQETDNTLNYLELPRSTGVLSTGEDFNNPVIVADPDLGKHLDDKDPSNDKFPTLAEINPSLEEFVVPFVQAGDYFGVKLGSGAHTLQFGAATAFGPQDVTYNILNPIEGKNRKDILIGTRENDYIDGKSGRDTLLGFWGDDLLVGGKGEDWLDGGFGKDELWGDEGKDTFIFKQGYGEDTIFDLESGEIVKLNWFSDYIKEDITLYGSASTKIIFNNHDILSIVGVQSGDLVVDLGKKIITLSSAVMVEPL